MGISYVRHYSHNNIGNFFVKIILSFLILCIPNVVTKLHAGLPAKPTVVANQQTVNVKDIMFGAKGDGVTDDTAAIQKAVDAVYKRGGGVINFPAGTYLVTSVNIREGITYQGYGATIKRPEHLTDKIGQPAAHWVRTFTNQKSPYGGQTDSKPLIIKGLTFDGSSQTQGPYQRYELEHAALVFLMGDRKFPGRLTAIVEDCVFRNGVGDGVHAYINTNLKMHNCKAENVFRGGFVLTGGHAVAEVKNLITSGKIDRTGIDVEISAAGYDNSKKVELYLENIQLLDGDFDIGVGSGSIVVGKNIKAEAPFNLYIKQSTARFSNCKFGVSSGNRILFPHDAVFTDCEFFASEKKSQKAFKFVTAAPMVLWNASTTHETNQKLTFNNCKFIVNDRVAGFAESSYGIYTTMDIMDFNNVLTINGGIISVKNGTGLAMMKRGGNWVVKNTVFDTDLALSFTGFPDSHSRLSWFNILLDGIVMKRGKYAHIGGYGPTTGGQANQNRLEQRHIVIEEENNYISSSYGLEGNLYVGSRVIQGANPPTEFTHGLIGDIYQVKGSNTKWICKKSGYVRRHNSGETHIKSQWEVIKED